jgi:acyl carrier protein
MPKNNDFKEKIMREEVVKRTQDIFRDIFNEPTLVISDSMSARNIGQWDSLNHINLLSAIQQEFAIKFALTELQSLNNVGAIIDLILKKIKN